MVYLYQYVVLRYLQLLHIKAHWTLFNIDVDFNSTSYSANAQYVNVREVGQNKLSISHFWNGYYYILTPVNQ